MDQLMKLNILYESKLINLKTSFNTYFNILSVFSLISSTQSIKDFINISPLISDV